MTFFFLFCTKILYMQFTLCSQGYVNHVVSQKKIKDIYRFQFAQRQAGCVTARNTDMRTAYVNAACKGMKVNCTTAKKNGSSSRISAQQIKLRK